MVYIIFTLTILIVFGAVVFVFLQNKNNNSDDPKDFVGLSLSQNHINFNNSYSFFLREEDGKIMFDAQLRSPDDLPYEIILESCEVDDCYMEKLREIQKKYAIVRYVDSFKEKKTILRVLDKTSNITSVYYKEIDSKTADTGAEYKEELYNFFVGLTKKYQSYSVAA